ncbi:helix-turn-helix domain-containing protein [Malikia granosa]|uniref:XRE family transcriptional regulator n=1 Tax=Malikia granosa TaxID=263067 RepID=A0A2S9K320_9BURK|nr:helix-turn-helix domain-containing protein [Malikia granosa]PRD64870.1 XRE family transcriptional regulator [Malikia granosa]
MSPRTQALVTSSQLGALLQGTRKSLKLTQAQLGERLGLSQRRISELERAPGTLSVDQLMALCALLGLQLTVQPRAKAPRATDDPTGEW